MKTQGLKTKNPQQGIFDILAEAVSSPTYCRPLLGLQAQPFESHKGCAQAHPSLLKTKNPHQGIFNIWRKR